MEERVFQREMPREVGDMGPVVRGLGVHPNLSDGSPGRVYEVLSSWHLWQIFDLIAHRAVLQQIVLEYSGQE